MASDFETQTVRELLRAAQSPRHPALGEQRLEAEVLLAHALGRDRAWLYAHDDARVESAQAARFRSDWQRRCAGEPVAYLLGRREFWSMNLLVSDATLIPRAETELLVQLALARLPLDRAVDVLDLGTGSGAIALAIACERPLARVLATDASADALCIAQANAEHLNLPNVTFRHGDWLDAIDAQRFDLVLSNPPYLGADDPHLDQGDLRFEPRSALVSGDDGLDALRCITRGAPEHLQPGGLLMVEHGQSQGAAVRALFLDAGLVSVSTASDMEGRERVTIGKASGPVPR